MGAIIKRELKEYFTLPLGYVALAVLLYFTGDYYSQKFYSGRADIAYVFSCMLFVILFVVPLITMRMLSEEKHQKTDQLLLTSPTSITSIVLGKFFAAIIYFLIFDFVLLILFLAYYIFGASPDFMVFLGNSIGFILIVAALISIGEFISALTESQIVAGLCGFAVSFMLLFVENAANYTKNDIVLKVTSWLSFSQRFSNFSEGIFDVANFVFFLSITAAFLFLTIRVIDVRRWA